MEIGLFRGVKVIVVAGRGCGVGLGFFLARVDVFVVSVGIDGYFFIICILSILPTQSYHPLEAIPLIHTWTEVLLHNLVIVLLVGMVSIIYWKLLLTENVFILLVHVGIAPGLLVPIVVSSSN